jgi:hypothetical protein
VILLYSVSQVVRITGLSHHTQWAYVFVLNTMPATASPVPLAEDFCGLKAVVKTDNVG